MKRPTQGMEGDVGWIAPGTGLCFSAIVALLAPHYPHWFGAALPVFTQRFLAAYPLWIAVCLVALIAQWLGRILDRPSQTRLSWKALDAVLAVASVLIIAAGIIALMLPVLLRPMPV